MRNETILTDSQQENVVEFWATGLGKIGEYDGSLRLTPADQERFLRSCVQTLLYSGVRNGVLMAMLEDARNRAVLGASSVEKVWVIERIVNPMIEGLKEKPQVNLDDTEEVYVLVQMAVPKGGAPLIDRVQERIEPLDKDYRMCALVASVVLEDSNAHNPPHYQVTFRNASYEPN